MRQRFSFCCGVVLLATSLASAQAPPRPAGIQVGQVFPNLVLPSLEDGRSASLTDFRGQKVILHIFASW